MASDKSQYESARRLIPQSAAPSWISDADDVLRYTSYGLYEDIYWTEPDTFKLQQRGTEENPIYIPSGRIIINTMMRYIGRDFNVIIDPNWGESSDQEALQLWMNAFVKRERLLSMFKELKLYYLIRGDAFIYITGDPEKPEGARVSAKVLDPRYVFPITAPKQADRVIGYDIAEPITEGEDTYVKRTRYLKPEHELHPNFGTIDAPISFQVDVYEVEGWQDPEEAELVRSDFPVTVMPPDIKTLPLYHFKNMPESGNIFGSSEMRGIERLFAAVNQSINDEDLALSLAGLGMYKSGKGQPRDLNGNPTNWVLGPGRVVHDDTFERVAGLDKIHPVQEHVKYMEDRMAQVNGASDVAKGIVDVTVAESGVALELRMGPITDAADDKEIVIGEVYDNFLYDLRSWFTAYEGVSFNEARPIHFFGPKLPKNKRLVFQELLQMVSNDPPLITMEYFREAAKKLGHDFPPEMDSLAVALERQQFAEVVDPYAGRLAEEGGGEEEIAVPEE